ncbi:hypothetical protein Tco_0200496, partial [Tanacetum coccineum]
TQGRGPVVRWDGQFRGCDGPGGGGAGSGVAGTGFSERLPPNSCLKFTVGIMITSQCLHHFDEYAVVSCRSNAHLIVGGVDEEWVIYKTQSARVSCSVPKGPLGWRMHWWRARVQTGAGHCYAGYIDFPKPRTASVILRVFGRIWIPTFGCKNFFLSASWLVSLEQFPECACIAHVNSVRDFSSINFAHLIGLFGFSTVLGWTCWSILYLRAWVALHQLPSLGVRVRSGWWFLIGFVG